MEILSCNVGFWEGGKVVWNEPTSLYFIHDDVWWLPRQKNQKTQTCTVKQQRVFQGHNSRPRAQQIVIILVLTQTNFLGAQFFLTHTQFMIPNDQWQFNNMHWSCTGYPKERWLSDGPLESQAVPLKWQQLSRSILEQRIMLSWVRDWGGSMTDPRPITSRVCQRIHQGTVPKSCGIPKEAQKRRERNYQVAATWVWSSGASFGSSMLQWNDGMMNISNDMQWYAMTCNDIQWYVYNDM